MNMSRFTNRLIAHATRLAITTLITGAAAACSDSDSVSPATASTITVVSGGAQTGVVNTALGSIVVVEVMSSSGAPVVGAVVAFAPSANAGSISATQATTDGSGQAAVVWTLGTVAGADTLVATIGSLSTTIVANATPDVAANLVVAAGNNQDGTSGSALSVPLSVKVTDQFGNAVSNVAVQWSDDHGGSFSTSTSLTDATGVAVTTYTLSGSTGVADVTASATSGAWSSSATFTEDGN
jgi:hypothetical protein